MKVLIVNSFDTFEYRILLMKRVLKELGHEVLVIGSDFRHIEKDRRVSEDPELVLLPAKAYYKNISPARLCSHHFFAQEVFQYIKDKPCDLLYLVVPPNSQAGLAKKYKKLYPNAEVVMDIIDLWPESFPSKYTGYFPFTLWGGIRNRNLKNADFIMTECNLYREKLAPYLKGMHVETLYWVKEEEKTSQEMQEEKTELPSNRWCLGYLGSVNHIIDVDKIAETIAFFKKDKPVELHIVGGGESLEELEQKVKEAGATVISHGKIYDAEKKKEIFSQCHYGLNMMKDTVVVGLSMKSIDYLQMGVPLINGLKGDTYEFVKKNKLGYNTDELSLDYDKDFRKNARAFYEENFSLEAFSKRVQEILDRNCKNRVK